ncbi:MAG: ATP-binding protein [Gammaproteobacteria bacterium]|nr:ATP-binding protein [Gammaproteobacteria bacterium]
MTDNIDKIPLAVDIDRIIEVLAAQIYQSPLALLRENTQNAFDAILLRKADDPTFSPRIDVAIKQNQVVITDNGIGMTIEDVKQHFWRAGSSSKNNEHAKAAGVVGTFGIGAMANFGVAKKLIVETEKLLGSERIISSAERESLSATENCIDVKKEAAQGTSGTTVTAILYENKPIDLNSATNYIKECVTHVQIPVYVNGELISQQGFEQSVPPINVAWKIEQSDMEISQRTRSDVLLAGDNTGEVRIELTNVKYNSQALPGKMILRQGIGAVKTYRSGFSLAPTSLSSVYRLGGIADFLFLRPTAGREALETESLQILQNIFTDVESFVSHHLSKQPQADMSNAFMQWVVNHGKYDLCGKITIRNEPGSRNISLEEIRDSISPTLFNYYEGQDASIIEQYASEDKKLLVAATSNPRKRCQSNYINAYCTNIQRIDDSPKVISLKKQSDYSLAESGLVFRLTSILEADYFVKARIELASLSHQLPVYIELAGNVPTIYINPNGSSASILLEVYQNEFEVFAGMVKDFVRSIIFPKIANFVPSATREGAEAFLKRMRSKREVYEYEKTDLGSLSEIWDLVLAGQISVDEGARRSQVVARRNVQVVDSGSAKSAQEVVPDIVSEAEKQLIGTGAEPGVPMPAISRTDIETDAKLLTIENSEQALNGFQCFLAITDRIREQNGEFFLQPHTTSVIWGGQRILLIFQHHSGRFGLYYDIQLPEIITEASGGEVYPTTTIALKNRIFIPIPMPIQKHLIPTGSDKKRLEVRCEIIHIDNTVTATERVAD